MKNQTRFHRLALLLIFSLASFLTLPAYAWPEVDHMNMCGSAVKVDRAYGGNFRGWAAHDNYNGYRTRAGYYYRTNCPKTVAPVKKASKKKVYKKKVVKVKKQRITRSVKARKFKRTVKYDLHADCIQVDRMNRTGPAVKVKSRNAYRNRWVAPVKVSYRRPAKKRVYNYFKK